VGVGVVHPEVYRFAAPLLTFEVVSENILMLAIGAGVTVYAASVVHDLRVEAFEARQLNQYRLKGRIGAGGMGEVYLAEHQLLKRPCALKLIAPDRAGDPRALTRFEREARVTARLSHPNTVEIYDYGRTDDGQFYYVMELLDGLSLAELVERHGPLPPGRAIFLLRQACGALAEAHAAGLVHRDLKPANIFAARRGNFTTSPSSSTSASCCPLRGRRRSNPAGMATSPARRCTWPRSRPAASRDPPRAPTSTGWAPSHTIS